MGLITTKIDIYFTPCQARRDESTTYTEAEVKKDAQVSESIL